MSGSNWLKQIEDAQTTDIPALVAKVQGKYRLWRIVGIVVALVVAAAE